MLYHNSKYSKLSFCLNPDDLDFRIFPIAGYVGYLVRVGGYLNENLMPALL